ncbi:putative endonuclease subunit [Rhizobium phage vB_RleM_P10VF]|uniref:Putative endonuclease subunit n=1 Tax=Rhizobium phage vB_RleM_P10VF TaxID=1527770 RepID=A0A076YIX2_9CAUD|nr:putative endonuclease subunit [Rhizobium phage vB_RleM_P10VF]AIK68408.1 putative endonuclease subunit [Rhizobium phage vB_RleM_P10VF]
MTDVFITGGFRLGKTNQNVDLISELEKYVEWLCEQSSSNPSLDGTALVVAGNFFDTKRALTIAQYHKANSIINRLNSDFEAIYFLVGDRDIPGRKNDGETLYDFFEFSHEDIHIIKEKTEIKAGKKTINLFPYGTKVDVDSFLKDDVAVFCDASGDIVKSPGIQYYNGQFPLWTKVDNYTSLGSPFQMSWDDVENPGGYVLISGSDENDSFVVPYKRKIFQKVALKDNKIDGKNPVKWLSDNKKLLDGTCLEVVIDPETDKTIYSKFVGVLGTVKLADLKLSETFSFTTDKTMSSSRPDFAESLYPLLSRDGSKSKLKRIIEKLGG